MIAAMDEVYSKPEFYWGQDPNDLCRDVLASFPGGGRGLSLLDLGCGEGRDSVAFARAGFDVTALDVSLPGLEKARRWATSEGLGLRTVQASIRAFRPDQPYDVVYGSGVLQHLPADEREAAFTAYKASTRVGGVHAFNVFVEKPFIALAPDWQPDEFLYRPGELLARYWDWEILAFDEIIFDCNSSGVPHRHAMDVMIARRVL